MKRLFARLESCLTRFYGDRLRVTVEPRRFIYLDLIVRDYQRRYVEGG